MSASTIFGFLVILVAAVSLDIAILRWRRGAWRTERSVVIVGRLGAWVNQVYERARQGLNRRAANVDEARLPTAVAGEAGMNADPGAATGARESPATEQPGVSDPMMVAAASAAPAAAEAVVRLQPLAGQPGAAGALAVPPKPANEQIVEQSPTVVTTSSMEYPGQVAGGATRGPSGGVARINISVELPVGATMRFTIETGVDGQPTLTQMSLPAQPAQIQPTQVPAVQIQPALAPVVHVQPAQDQSALAPAVQSQPAQITSAQAIVRPAMQPDALVSQPTPTRRDGPARTWAGGVSALSAIGSTLRRPAGQWGGAWRANWPRLQTAVSARFKSIPQVLFWSSVAVYLLTRLIGIDRYPIYFFTDEAVHTVLAADFVHAGLQNSAHEFLPTYFPLGPSFNLNGVSVYLQSVPYLLFGKSEFVTRATSALVTLIAAIAVGLILRDIFKRRYWWTATLLLAIAPAWFLHSRTAFEYIEVASYYAGFLYCYLRYRYLSPRSLYGAIIFAALAFYTHGLGQVLMGVITVLLAVSDWRYHWQQRATIQRGLVLGLVLLVPYVRYSLAHPGTTIDQLRQRGSYWVQDDLPLSGKVSHFLSEYLFGLSPQFWFLADNGRDIQRHVMKGYGNLWLPTLPLLVVGLVNAVRNLRSSASRTVLLAVLAAPVGSALVAIGIPRVLWAIIPLTLLSAIGLSLLLEWLEDHRVPRSVLAGGAFVLLAGVSVYMLRDALVNGGLWSTDYTLDGTQFGARQVFGEAVPDYLAQHPDAQVIVSATWANGTDMFIPFFLTPDQMQHVHLQSLDYFLSAQRDLPANLEVVLPAYEYDKALQNPKLADIVVDKTVSYPNGQPGFYFLRLAYSAQAAGLFAAEEAALHRPVVEHYTLDGQDVTITHPTFGAGQLHDMLDGNPFTLINAPGFNPIVLDFVFPTARPISGLTLITGSLPDFTVTATVYAEGTDVPQIYSQEFTGLPADPTVMLNFDKGPSAMTRLHLEIYNDADNGPGVNIHVREVEFR